MALTLILKIVHIMTQVMMMPLSMKKEAVLSWYVMNSNASNSSFSLAMKFSTTMEFKNVIIQYTLAERRVINFPKDESQN